MQHFKLGFRNRTVLEQLSICERAIAGMADLPEEQRLLVHYAQTRETVTALRDCHNRVEMLRSELKGEVARRKELLRESRVQTTHSALGLQLCLKGDRAKLLAAGLDLAAPNRIALGECPAPESFRAEMHALEGAVKLRWNIRSVAASSRSNIAPIPPKKMPGNQLKFPRSEIKRSKDWRPA